MVKKNYSEYYRDGLELWCYSPVATKVLDSNGMCVRFVKNLRLVLSLFVNLFGPGFHHHYSPRQRGIK